MTWLLWLGLILCLLAVAAAGLSAYGEHRWAGATQPLLGKLEAGRRDGTKSGRQSGQQNDATPPTRYDARELDGLPAPV